MDGKPDRCGQCGASPGSISLTTTIEVFLLCGGVLLLGLGGYCAVAWWGQTAAPDPGWDGIQRLPYWMMLGGVGLIAAVLHCWRLRRGASKDATPRRRF